MADRTVKITADDIDALARIVEAEAGVEPLHGKVAVLDVILNRAAAGRRWPSNIQGVIEQKSQFEPVMKAGGSWRKLPEAPNATKALVLQALQTRAAGARPDVSNGATIFYDPTVTAKRGTDFNRGVEPVAAIGGHHFFNRAADEKPTVVSPFSIAFDDGLSPTERASASLSQGTSAPTYDPERLARAARPNVNVAGLNPALGSGLDAFIAAAPGRISISSGFRTPEHQAQILADSLNKRVGPDAVSRWNQYVSDAQGDVVAAGAAARPWLQSLGITQWVAPPGSSNHQRGIAADLQFENDDVRKWAHANAAKYGLQFPLSNEPWHVEPVGSRDGTLLASVNNSMPGAPGKPGAQPAPAPAGAGSDQPTAALLPDGASDLTPEQILALLAQRRSADPAPNSPYASFFAAFNA